MKIIKNFILLLFIIFLGAGTGYIAFKYYNSKQVTTNSENITDSTSSSSSLMQNIELEETTDSQSLLLNPNKIEQTN